MKRRSRLARGIAALAVAAFCAGVLPGCAPQRPPAPPKPVPSPPPPAAPAKEKIIFRPVHFGFDSYHIRPGDAAVLDEAAATLSKHPDLSVHIDGYCDARGGVKYNLRLSEKRAKAVAAYLEGKGIAASRLIPRGFGKAHFVAPNDTEEGRAQNRRVELVPIQ